MTTNNPIPNAQRNQFTILVRSPSKEVVTRCRSYKDAVKVLNQLVEETGNYGYYIHAYRRRSA